MNLLSIAGSDPSSGAGIQRDLRVWESMGHKGFTAITAITSQNSSEFLGVDPVPAKTVRSQIHSVLDDFTIDAIKVGVVYSNEIIKVVSEVLARYDIPTVLDPIIHSTTGGRLLREDAVGGYVRTLLPLATVTTPNVTEASILSGVRIETQEDIVRAARKLVHKGSSGVIITGLKEKGRVYDCICTGADTRIISSDVMGAEVHGSGCTYSAALAAALASGDDMIKAALTAARHSRESITSSHVIGRGVAMAGDASGGVIAGLQSGIRLLVETKGIQNLIPEVQTNFAYAKERPSSRHDVLAVQGRIVRSGDRVVPVGPLVFGASTHVASAILGVNDKFPMVRSALNIRFGEDILERVQSAGMMISSYDRRREPDHIKGAEGSSIPWGVQDALAGATSAPDVIFHRGSHGKEPMIMIFGITPEDVVRKVRDILG